MDGDLQALLAEAKRAVMRGQLTPSLDDETSVEQKRQRLLSTLQLDPQLAAEDAADLDMQQLHTGDALYHPRELVSEMLAGV